MDQRVLLLFTNHRVAEKLWPIIPELSKNYVIDLFSIGLFSNETPWVGDIDERELKLEQYKDYIDNITQGPGVQFHGDRIKQSLCDYIDISKYKFVIYDDNRKKPEYNIPSFYQYCKQNNVIVIGNSHGNEDSPHNEIGTAYDYSMDFSKGGIPTNDTLKHVKGNNKHILVITNFLSNRSSIFPVNFDKTFIQRTGLLELQEKFQCPIKVKIKTRLDKPNYVEDINYVKSILDCDVVTNCEDIDQLIADSILIVAAPSTLCFKPIQLGIPTVLIKGAGAVGAFDSYPGLVEMQPDVVKKNIEEQIEHGRYNDYIKNTIKGGEEFCSTKHYVKHIENIDMNKERLVVYTALFTDDIEHIHGTLPEYRDSSIEFICFTNTPHLKSNTWDIRLVDCELSARKQARKYKMLPHKYLPNYDAWIWMDNSCLFKYDPVDLFELYMTNFDMCLHEHCDRSNIIQEAEVIIQRNLDDSTIVNNQIKKYLREQYEDYGLYETGILMRRNNSHIVSFNEMWWAEINNNSIRDQISFPYVLWKHNWIRLNAIKETFVAHQTLLNKKQSEHFYTVPKNKIKLT